MTKRSRKRKYKTWRKLVKAHRIDYKTLEECYGGYTLGMIKQVMQNQRRGNEVFWETCKCLIKIHRELPELVRRKRESVGDAVLEAA